MGDIIDNIKAASNGTPYSGYRCNSCTNVGCKFQSGIVRTECAFYIPPRIEPYTDDTEVKEKKKQESDFDRYEYCEEFIKEHFQPVADKPGYVWFSKRNFEIISVETFAKSLDEAWVKGVSPWPLAESEEG